MERNAVRQNGCSKINYKLLKPKLIRLLAYTLAVSSVFSFFFGFYFWFLNYFNISLIGTANGAWKVLGFQEYLLSGKLESGDLLYFPILNLIKNLFGLTNGLEYYRAIVLLNGFCSALLLSLVFFISYIKLHSLFKSILITLIHFTLGGIFILSINNEDIFPSYLFFIIGAYFLFEYFSSHRTSQLFLAALCFSISTLLHWTSGIPAFGALFFSLILEKSTLKEKSKQILITAFVPTVTFLLFSLLFNYPFFKICFPNKGNNSLWISGFQFSDIFLGLINSLSFLSGGVANKCFQCLSFFNYILSFIGLFWIVPGVILVYRNINKTTFKPYLKFFYFIWLVFFLGTVMNLYEQGSDLQFFIQPNALYLYLILLIIIHSPSKPLVLSIILISFILNVSIISFSKNKDLELWENVDIIQQHVTELEKTLVISQGFEVFDPLAMIKVGETNYHYLHIPEANQREFYLSDSEFLQLKIEKIEQYKNLNYEIILINFINKPASEIGESYEGYNFTAKIAALQNYITCNFEIEKISNTKDYTFYKITPL